MQSAAIAIIFSKKKDHVLLVKRRDTPIWVLPGGGIDPGENPCDAVLREVKEETGYDCVVVKEAAYYYPVNRLSGEVYTFICEIIDGELAPCPKETQNAGFYNPNSVPGLLLPLHKHWIQDAKLPLTSRIEAPVPVSYLKLIIFSLRHPWIALRYGLKWDFWKRFF